MKVIVYLRAADARALEASGKDPALWVRALVRSSLDKKKVKR